MKKFYILFIILCFSISVNAEIAQHKTHSNLPQGTFKKNRSGKIIQYDNNGKKIGVYKIPNGRYIKVK